MRAVAGRPAGHVDPLRDHRRHRVRHRNADRSAALAVLAAFMIGKYVYGDLTFSAMPKVLLETGHQLIRGDLSDRGGQHLRLGADL
jgi:hypothetical protein